MTETARAVRAAADVTQEPRGGFRGDIEGLRTVAIVAVLLYHAGVPGADAGFAGVDVFFVVSGFLITGVMLREIDRTGRLSIAGFYARRARRLLPAAALVLVVCAVLSAVLLPPTQRHDAGWDVAAAAGYVVNWVLASRAVDYLAEDAGASPVQHFWSLAVEEQFYVLWPLVLVAAVLVARRLGGTGYRGPALVLLTVLAGVSFAFALLEDGSPAAFFVTTTRLWELAAGALLAIVLPGVRRWRPRALTAAGWAGAVLLVAAAFVLAEPRTWPGLATLLPVLGTVLVLAAGSGGPRGALTRALGTRPMVWVGGLSYSLYLWHWPLLVFARAVWGDIGPLEGLAVVLVSVLPAWLSLHLLENPVRRTPYLAGSTRRSLALGAMLTAVGLVTGGVLAVTTDAKAPTEAERAEARGASALLAGDAALPPRALTGSVLPTPVAAPKDLPVAYADGCQAVKEATDLSTCVYGDPEGTTTVAAVGDSKMLQWQPVLDRLAREQGWKLVVLTKTSCAWTAATPHIDGEPYDECVEWNQRLDEELERLDPAVILTSQYQSDAIDPSGGTSVDAMVDGLRTVWESARARGATVGVVLDNPHPEGNVYECVAAHPDALVECAFDRDAGTERSAAPVQRLAADGVDGVEVVDLTSAVCTQTCWPVVGDVLVYRQTTHLTRTYVESTLPQVREALAPVLARAGADADEGLASSGSLAARA
ncbi:acyltransferase family protein [Cellulosimicrobium sp. KWT-B]|uniref:acyltransferase family protein n=1 Tax=Cellulosimicrobium sp. KWT-B TaxID=1981152 RepID=UPI000A320F6E|nr:acyltransferase family protein [Cellulosimicrobium sp. KWT-B]